MNKQPQKPCTVTFETSEGFLHAFDTIRNQLGCSRAELIQYILDRWTRSVLNEPRMLSLITVPTSQSQES